MLPESVADLPPLAGILTAGAGNPLSHVQLLARNLGIPNVAVDESLLPELRGAGRQAHRARGEPGRAGRDQRGWSALGCGVRHAGRRPTRTSCSSPTSRSSTSRKRDFVSLEALRAADSGRIVGPKAAKLGELKSHFPDRVALGRRHPVRGLPRRRCSIAPTATPARRSTSGWWRASASSRRCRPARSEAEAVRREAARGDLLDRAQHRSGPEVPRAAARGDGEGVRTRTSTAACSCAPTPTSRTCPASPARGST